MSHGCFLSWLVGLVWCFAGLTCGCAANSPAAKSPRGDAAVAQTIVLLPSDLVPVHVEDLSLGSRSAPVTLVAFLDLECPFCAKAWDTLEQLRNRYGADQLRIVVKYLPLAFHKHATSAAQTVVAVQRQHGDLAAAKFMQRVLHSQEQLTDAALQAWAAESSPIMDPDAPSTRVFSLDAGEQLQRDQALAARLGIDGTPSFRINGIPLEGALSASEFERLIDLELVEVQHLVAKGLRPGDVYATRVATNHRPPQVEPTKEPQKDPTRWAVPIGNSPQLGPSTAPVTIVSFMDYECPFCQRGFSTLKQLHDKYPSQLRIVWKHRPLDFHEQAAGAAEFAVEVRKQKGDLAFWDVCGELFSQQAELSSALYARIANRLGLDQSAWQNHVSNGDTTAVLSADSDDADAFGVEGTPQFFVNGLRVKGSKPIEEFVELIERELAAAAALKQGGTAEPRIAAALMAEAKPAPEPPSIDPALRLPEGPSTGPSNAKVTIHAFSDYQCPYCQRADTTVRSLLAKYPKDVRLIWHDLPLGFHDRARAAATLAREVLAQKGADAFFEIGHTLFAKQTDLSEASLLQYAKAMGVRDEPLLAERRDQAHGKAIDSDRELAEQLHISGTPTFIVGRYLLEGAQPMRSFERLIRLELSRQPARKASKLR